MDTIKELSKYLEENYYSFLELTIGDHHAPEGIIIEQKWGRFKFSYSERGKKSVIKSFCTEKKLVNYALDQLNQDEWSRAHIVACTLLYEEIVEAERELNNKKINFKRNDIPNYKVGMTAYRIFVFGKDVAELTEFKKLYLHALS